MFDARQRSFEAADETCEHSGLCLHDRLRRLVFVHIFAVELVPLGTDWDQINVH
jgi:hypothetical protein